jgi:hypothetical protein
MSDAVTNFVLMLTERDVTIPDAVEVYSTLTVDSLRHIAFKDVGADQGMLKELTDAIHDDGRSALLEIADMSDHGQEAGLQLAMDLGVDKVVAVWRADFADSLRSDKSPEYWPFLGSLSGSPLKLESTSVEIAAMAEELSCTEGVTGVVLMPYRQETYDASLLLRETSKAAAVPVLVAGGVSETSQIECIARSGAWGFTMGSAVLSSRQHDSTLVDQRVTEILKQCQMLSGALPN